jgi:hypothetical protein
VIAATVTPEAGTLRPNIVICPSIPGPGLVLRQDEKNGNETKTITIIIRGTTFLPFAAKTFCYL